MSGPVVPEVVVSDVVSGPVVPEVVVSDVVSGPVVTLSEISKELANKAKKTLEDKINDSIKYKPSPIIPPTPDYKPFIGELEILTNKLILTDKITRKIMKYLVHKKQQNIDLLKNKIEGTNGILIGLETEKQHLNGKIEELTRQLNELHKTNESANKGDTTSLNDQISKLTGQIGKLNGQIGNLNDQIGKLNGQIGNLNDQIKTLQNTNIKLTQQMNNLTAEMKDLKNANNGLKDNFVKKPPPLPIDTSHDEEKKEEEEEDGDVTMTRTFYDGNKELDPKKYIIAKYLAKQAALT